MKANNQPSKLNLVGLNALRGIAAVMIVIFHVHGIPNLALPASLSFIQNYFGLGVPLFFVISAFSLYLSTSPRVGSEGWLSAYFIRRIMRVAPLFYLVAVFYLIFIPLHFGVYISPLNFIGTISFLFNLMPGQHESMVWAGWTIGVEMLFYLILPYFLIFVKNVYTSAIALAAGLVISSIFYKFYSSDAYPSGYAYMSFMGSIGVFMYGIFGYHLFKSLQSTNPQHLKLLGNFLLTISVALLFISYIFEPQLTGLAGNRSNIWGFFFVSIIISQCLAPTWLISNRFTAYIGKLSFGLYLCHPPIVEMLKPLYKYFYELEIGTGVSFTLSALATLSVLIPTAQLASSLIEKNGISLGELIVKKRIASDNTANVIPQTTPLAKSD